MGYHAYAPIKGTLLDTLIQKVCQFLDANAHLIFWGGAVLSCSLSPQYFTMGVGLGALLAELTPLPKGEYGWKGVHTTPLDRTIQGASWVVSRLLPPNPQAFLNGCSPGHLLHRMINGQYYAGMKGLKAVWYEVEWITYEMSLWFPWVDTARPELPKKPIQWFPV